MSDTNEIIIEIMNILRRKAEFHRTNQNDPHGIDTACMVALGEVADAIGEAFDIASENMD